jgi:methyltransferase (TIGR00027 family)
MRSIINLPESRRPIYPSHAPHPPLSPLTYRPAAIMMTPDAAAHTHPSGRTSETAMKEDCPSATALSVAARRAAHQVVDDPKVFDDPLALRILGLPDASYLDPQWTSQDRFPRGLRAFLAARSRYAEDELHAAVGSGVRQYVVLGAGLDTFACRSPYPPETLAVFEVDHPATQRWKRERLAESNIPAPPSLTFVPVDFETETLADGLGRTPFDAGAPAFFSWLGVVQYLTEEAVFDTLSFVASLAAGSSIVFDYTVAPECLSPRARAVLELLASRTAETGEPFRASFDPGALARRMTQIGFTECRNVSPEDLNALYFTGDAYQLSPEGFTRVMNARV